MEYRRLGQTGLKISAIGYGNMVNGDPAHFDRDFEIVKYLVEQGVNFLDTAEIYGSETQLGNILKKLNAPRADLVISTKIYFGTGTGGVNSRSTCSRKHLIEGLQASLGRLQLDYVDIVFAHRYDFETPVEEVCRAMDWIINNNKAFYWGTSEWPAAAIVEAHAVCDRLGLIHPAAEQPGYHMLNRERMEVELVPLFDKFGMGATIFSPLGGGILTGKYNSGVAPKGSRMENAAAIVKNLRYDPYLGEKTRDATIKKLDGMAELAKELGCSLPQLAVAWTLKNKDVSSTMIGGKSLDQVKECLEAVSIYKKLTPEIEERIEKILETRPQPPFNWKSWGPFPPRR